jgi:hypothetical protein
MTNKLVNEINYHMKSVTRPISRISFIGHSLGCILIRCGNKYNVMVRAVLMPVRMRLFILMPIRTRIRIPYLQL